MEKDRTILTRLNSNKEKNHIYSKLMPEDPARVCDEIQGAEILKAEIIYNPPGNKDSDKTGIILYLRTWAGKYKAVELSPAPDNYKNLYTKVAEIRTQAGN